jgi:hypothetical protein
MVSAWRQFLQDVSAAMGPAPGSKVVPPFTSLAIPVGSIGGLGSTKISKLWKRLRSE